MLKVVANGSNAKLGAGVATTYRPVGITCPKSCPLLGNGCYAQSGNVAIHARRSEHDKHELHKATGNTLVRHFVSGDAFKSTADNRRVVDRRLLRDMIGLHESASWLQGWGYTHDAERLDRAGFGPDNMPDNLTLLASCHTAKEKQEHNARGWQTARVISEKHERLPDEVLCPHDLAKREGKPAEQRITCARCRLCFDGKK